MSRVTVDNVRRILSSFFSWLEDEPTKFTTGTDLERAKTITDAINFIVDREKDKEKDTFIKDSK